jgi:hypothetical protein
MKFPIGGALLASALLLAACGDDSTPADATPDAARDAGSTVAAPEPTNSPILTPCPTGWREVDGHCDPWPEGGAEDCPLGQAHFPGGTGCEVVGDPCPSGAFASDLPAGTVYVDASATGGDGTMAAPFTTIADARASLPGGSGTIALARGAYDEDVRVESGDVTLIGACASETSLTRTMGETPRAIASARGGQLTIRNLRIFGAEIGVAAITNADSVLTLEGVQIDGTTSALAVAWDDAQLVIRDSVLRDTENGTQVDWTGRGVQFIDNGVVTLERVVMERIRDVAILGARASISLSDVAIRGVEPLLSAEKGRAIEISGATTANLERVVVEDAHEVAILAGQEGTMLTGEDLVVRRIEFARADPGAVGGRGIEVAQGAQAALSRVFIDEASSIAMTASSGANVTLTDAIVQRTRPRFDDTQGRGFEAWDETTTSTLERVHFDQNHDTAILVSGAATMTATDLTLSSTASEVASGIFGAGIAVQYGATVEITRASIHDNHSHGIFVITPDTSVTATDLVVTDNLGWEANGVGGVGAGAQNGSHLTISRSLFQRNRAAGILSHGGAEVTLTDVSVLETMDQECVETGDCVPGSAGFLAFMGGHLSAERFLVADGSLAGVQVDIGGEADLRIGAVRGHVIGAAVATEGFDTNRLTDRVEYTDNETSLDTRSLPLPELGDPLAGSEGM